MRNRRSGRAALVLALVLAGGAAATVHDGGSVAATGCPQPYPVRLELSPGGATAAAIVTCTDAAATSLWLHNTGDFVWRITANRASVTQHTRTYEANARRAAIGEVYRFAVLGPDTALTVHTFPAAVTVQPDDHLSTVWWTHELLNDILTDDWSEAVIESATVRSRVGGTLATCAIAAGAGYKNLGTLRNDDEQVERFLAAVGVTSNVSSCATSWASLGDEVDDVPPWRKTVMSLTDEADFLAKANTFLDRMNTLRKLIPVL